MAKERKGPPMKTWGLVKEANNAYDKEIQQAIKKGKPVVTSSACVPPQMYEGFDVVHIAGEWYGSICGFHQDIDALETAEQCGFPHEVCSYSRMMIGSMISDKSWLGKYPRPKAILGVEGMCNMHGKWFETLARYNNIPFFSMDITPIYIEDLPNWGGGAIRDAVDYATSQIWNYIDFMEWALGQKVNVENMISACINSRVNEELWDDIMIQWRHVPSPVTIRSLFTYENIIISLICAEEGTKVLSALRDELAERIEKGISGIVDEEIRLLWNAQPGWYIMGVFRFFENLGATFVASPYLNMFTHHRPELMRSNVPEWVRERKDPTNLGECVEEMAKYLICHHFRFKVDVQVEGIIRLAKEAEIDGGVWHNVRACKGASYGELSEKAALKKELDIPGLLIEGSPADPRDFSEESSWRQIRIFVEQLRGYKKRKKA